MKKPADAILDSLKGEDEEGSDEGSEESHSEDKKRAAGEEFASALKSGDGLKIANALDDLLACCGY